MTKAATPSKSQSALVRQDIWFGICRPRPGPTVTISNYDHLRNPALRAPHSCVMDRYWQDNGTWAVQPPRTVTFPKQDVLRKVTTLVPHSSPTTTGKSGQDKERSQFYTRYVFARRFYRSFQNYFDPADFQMIEPSAGRGVFLKLLPTGSFGCDIEPKGVGIVTADFLKLHIHSGQRIACIGNPPFGRNANMAIDFFNHAASFSYAIGFILPRTFRKTWAINRLNEHFHLGIVDKGYPQFD